MIEDGESWVARSIFLSDITDPRLALYRNIKATNETRSSDEFVLEGEKLFDALRLSRFPMRSVLATDRRAHLIAARVPPGVPFYVMPHDRVSKIVGYDFHLGVLSTGERQRWPELEEVLKRGTGFETAALDLLETGAEPPSIPPSQGGTLFPSLPPSQSGAMFPSLPLTKGEQEGVLQPSESEPPRTPLDSPFASGDERKADLPSRESAFHTLVICPRIDNPDNLGAILRIGDVFGIDALIVGGRCPDSFSRRVLRVSMGTALRLPLYAFEDIAPEWERLRSRWGFQFAAAVTDTDSEPIQHFIRPRNLALVLGAESPGLAPEWVAQCDRRVTIPMRPGADSLNVAVAAGILLHRLMDVSPSPDRRL